MSVSAHEIIHSDRNKRKKRKEKNIKRQAKLFTTAHYILNFTMSIQSQAIQLSLYEMMVFIFVLLRCVTLPHKRKRKKKRTTNRITCDQMHERTKSFRFTCVFNIQTTTTTTEITRKSRNFVIFNKQEKKTKINK